MDRLMSRPEVEQAVGASRSTLYVWMRRGDFLAPLKIGPRNVRWRESEIRAWIDSRPRATSDLAK